MSTSKPTWMSFKSPTERVTLPQKRTPTAQVGSCCALIQLAYSCKGGYRHAH
ncbi:hypothetical protein SCLCIDRAFT_1210485 [Scleroderma citrinum Foug A]|uniref:Uncharacterized protein n=1 Tax=Scleroderma citrinum Foug A TaxID=1036808 RepID=A0A0C3APY4_9AGAM|nr:hypothetical protein SCLCIDRAFT_1210485 [Scleroderma citrinum Foug A]